MSSYEPELFPGLIIRMRGSSTVFLVFKTGELVITGAKTFPEIVRSFREVRIRASNCKPVEGQVDRYKKDGGVLDL